MMKWPQSNQWRLPVPDWDLWWAYRVAREDMGLAPTEEVLRQSAATWRPKSKFGNRWGVKGWLVLTPTRLVFAEAGPVNLLPWEAERRLVVNIGFHDIAKVRLGWRFADMFQQWPAARALEIVRANGDTFRIVHQGGAKQWSHDIALRLTTRVHQIP